FWHKLLKDNPWVLSQIFACPYLLIGDEYYYGGKKGNNKGGVYGDFFSKNDLTGNVAFVEIKTPGTELLASKYRGDKDEDHNTVYSINEDITGAINQLQNQRAVYMNKKDSLEETHSSYNSKAILIAGTIGHIKEKAKIKSFELFRNSLNNSELITFDELRKRIQLLIDIYKE
ncbi:DUF4263 domain-containing protein, partial [Candidatus Dojkabacteria bacterium]|nr:DUF4263 domain-containing protein [Candidatus Dojkabacteria bacterium]